MWPLFANVLPPCEPLVRLTGIDTVVGVPITDFLAMMVACALIAAVLVPPSCRHDGE